MDLVSLLITILILGLIFWLIFWVIGILPIPEPFKTVAYVILAIIVIVYLLSFLPGVGTHLHSIHGP
jgi:hypothetical protein